MSGEWQTAVSTRELRRKEKLQEKKRLVAEERAKRKESAQLALEQKEKEREIYETKRNKLFSIDYDSTALTNKQVGNSKKIKKRTKKNKKASQLNQPVIGSEHASITIDGIKTFFNDISNLSTVDLQLKRLGEYFENGFENVKEFDSEDILSMEIEENIIQIEYSKPLQYLTQPVKTAVKNWLNKIPKDSLELFFWFIVSQLSPTKSDTKIHFSTKGTGLKALLQLIIIKHPGIFKSESFEKKLKKFMVVPKKTRLIANVQEITPIQLTLAQHNVTLFSWIFIQLQDFSSIYLTVWFKYLLPLLCFSSISDQVWNLITLSFFVIFANDESILETAISRSNNEHVIGLERLIILFHSLEDLNKKKEIGHIYNLVKNDLCLFGTKKSPRYYFNMLLSHAAMNGDDNREEELRDDICSLLTSCLSYDLECFTKWSEIYPRFIPQSNNLLLFIILNWSNLSSQIDNVELIKISKSFMSVNKLILSGNYKLKLPKGVENRKLNLNKQNIRICSVTCKAMIKKVNSSWTTRIMKYSILFMMLFLILFFYYCISKGCRTELCSLFINCTKK